MAKKILVTGGNSGIGFALCRQLATEHECHVFLGARSEDKGREAVKSILDSAPSAKVEFLLVDVSNEDSVKAAAVTLQENLGSDTLYGLVNNAGIAGDADTSTLLNTNLYGTKRMCEAFLPLINPSEGRIVNVGSGSGPTYVKNQVDVMVKKQLCSEDQTWEKIEAYIASVNLAEVKNGYGFSKAMVTNYTSALAKEYPDLKINVCTPGWIGTNLGGKPTGSSKTPDEGTPAIKHLLFGELTGNGWYYGSDGVRSPLHFMRSPGQPKYDGVVPDSFD